MPHAVAGDSHPAMRRLVAATALLAACGPTPASFQVDYARRWCEVVETQCPDDVLPDLCRSIGVAPIEAPFTDCDFDVTAASTCVTTAPWTCSDAGEVEPPEICARVWSCAEDEGT